KNDAQRQTRTASGASLWKKGIGSKPNRFATTGPVKVSRRVTHWRIAPLSKRRVDQVGAALGLHVDVGEAPARRVAVSEKAVLSPGEGNPKTRNARYGRARHWLTRFRPAFFAR